MNHVTDNWTDKVPTIFHLLREVDEETRAAVVREMTSLLDQGRADGCAIVLDSLNAYAPPREGEPVSTGIIRKDLERMIRVYSKG